VLHLAWQSVREDQFVGTRILFRALALAALICTSADAQVVRPQRPIFATPEQTLQVIAGSETGPLVARFYPNRSGYITGTIFGDAIAGYHSVSGGQNKLAFIRYRNGAPVQVFTGDGGPGGWSGFAQGLAAPFATDQSNTVGFVTLPVLAPGRLCPRWVSPCPPATLPTPPTPPAVGLAASWTDTAAGFSIAVGGSRGALVLRDSAAPNTLGVFEGRVFSDRIVGHYAEGHIVFVRYTDANTPFQVWRGVLDASGNGIRGGRVYPLAHYVVSDPPQPLQHRAPFDWTVYSLDQALVEVRSTGGNSRCLNEGPVIGGDCTRQWVLHVSGSEAVIGQGVRSLFSLVHINNGHCLHLSQVTGDPVIQAACDGSDNQALVMQEAFYSIDGERIEEERILDVADFQMASNLTIAERSSWQCMSVRNDLAIVSGDCDSLRANWARVP
jgi:hypothetical protein